MNINELKYFIKVADQQSLSKAANELYISYQGLSKSLKSLETELNCSLFEKSGSGYKLTEYGEELYPAAKLIVSEWETLQLSLHQIQRRRNHFFHIGVAMGVDTPFANFRSQLDLFLRKHNNVVMIDAWDSYCEEKIESGELDIAITFGPVNDVRFECTVLLQGTLAALVHPENSLWERKSLRIQDLADQEIITVNRYFRNYDILMQACQSRGFKPRIVLNTVNLTATLLGYQNRKAIGISNNLCYPMESMGAYKVIPVLDQKTTCQINLLIHPRQRANKEIQQLKQELLQCFFVSADSVGIK